MLKCFSPEMLLRRVQNAMLSGRGFIERVHSPQTPQKGSQFGLLGQFGPVALFLHSAFCLKVPPDTLYIGIDN